MKLSFNTDLVATYHSKSQIIRVLSENWLIQNMYCPCCGYPRLQKAPNNSPVRDALCYSCGENFELKAVKQTSRYLRKISDGAYSTMIERITSYTNPNLLVMKYDGSIILDLVLVLKFFFQASYIEERRPLGPDAKRKGWIGCNILFSDIPIQGKIPIVEGGIEVQKENVLTNYNKVREMAKEEIDSRSWFLDVLQCVNKINKTEFCLNDVYQFADALQEKHPNNRNIHAKIRQQLQLLRDNGIIEFLQRGEYRKIG